MKYKARPVIIEAVQWTGENHNEISEFLGREMEESHDCYGVTFTIGTIEGTLIARVGDYIIKGTKGEYYPCKPDIFKEKYEQIGE
jgi:hypothetical protein